MPRWRFTTWIGNFVERIYGREGETRTFYLLRIKLTPGTPYGGLYLHIFYRGDLDPHPHDHPWKFWTFPLVGYNEEIYDPATGESQMNRVHRFHLQFRPAIHTHRVLSAIGDHKIVTLVWHGPKERSWGFWVDGQFVWWRDYFSLEDEA